MTTSKWNSSTGREWQHSNVQKSRLEKMIIRFSSWKMFVQSILMIPSFIVPLYFGIHYMGQCPIQPLIDVYLIVQGCLNFGNVLLLLLAFIAAKCISRSPDPSPYARYMFIGSMVGQLVLFLFSIAWLIAGQIWIFGARSNGFQTADPIQSATYCRGALYWNAFASIIITYVIMLVFTLVFVVRFIVKRYKAKRKAVSTLDEC